MIEEKDRVKKEKKRKDPTFVEARDFHQVVFENIDLTAQFEDPETHEILSKQVLQNVSGKAQSGQILGIIGNSGKYYLFVLFSSLISLEQGTGKTSLLRVLRGEIFIKRGEKATGNLLIDGIPINIQHNKEEMKKLYGIEEKDAQHEHQAKIQPPQPQSVKGKLDVNFIGEVSGGSIYVMILTRAIRQQKNTDRVRSASCSSKLEHNISQRHRDWLL